VDRCAEPRDRGDATIETFGIVALAALLVTAMIAGVALYPERLAQAVCVLTSAVEGRAADCGDAAPPDSQEPTDDDFLPPVCMLHEESEQYEAAVKVWFFEFGQNSGFIVQEFADGTVRVTVTDGVGLGAGGTVSSSTFDAGKLGQGDNAGLDIDLGGGIKLSYGDTWLFDDQEQWKTMKGQLDDYLVQQEVLKTRGGYWGAKAMGWKDPPKDPEVSFAKFELEIGLEAGLGLRSPTGALDEKGEEKFFDPKIGATLEATGSTAVVMETNHATGERSYTYELSGEGSVGAELGAGGGSAQGKSSGAFTVTRDEDGKVTELVFNSVREGGVEGHLGNDSFESVGGKGGKSESTSTVTETRLKVDGSNRAMVDQWLSERGDYGVALSLPFSAMVPDKPSDDPFLQHLYEKATTSKIQYHNVKDGWEFEAAVKKGWQFGFAVSGEQATADAVDAQFLGAPRQDGVRPFIPDATCK